jgi:alpha/beta superfamily hydrolase
MDRVTFTTEDGSLEGSCGCRTAAPGAPPYLSPHPRHGGSKDHRLLWAMRNDLAAARGLAVLGFNFRGVKGSRVSVRVVVSTVPRGLCWP